MFWWETLARGQDLPSPSNERGPGSALSIGNRVEFERVRNVYTRWTLFNSNYAIQNYSLERRLDDAMHLGRGILRAHVRIHTRHSTLHIRFCIYSTYTYIYLFTFIYMYWWIFTVRWIPLQCDLWLVKFRWFIDVRCWLLLLVVRCLVVILCWCSPLTNYSLLSVPMTSTLPYFRNINS